MLMDILLAAAVERGRAAAVALRSYKGGGLARGDRSASFLDGAAGEPLPTRPAAKLARREQSMPGPPCHEFPHTHLS
jgi:hypothetical protein